MRSRCAWEMILSGYVKQASLQKAYLWCFIFPYKREEVCLRISKEYEEGGGNMGEEETQKVSFFLSDDPFLQREGRGGGGGGGGLGG